ncbi:uncharacterized protein F4822DRAFT_231081 [Hypoxylon trugodes]|uniref:uncharacterized protein n=1 Tax=Hypoxylon trugodes TaxID=326681 RepID=UPI002192AABA|nr:uncharacterized protein F4822DRAFT_231081 [Hypoxylon trugodes]KAI1390268.1 hypothetical protein F4822DRAFT_231081 [Hypoxylon trugodes]
MNGTNSTRHSVGSEGVTIGGIQRASGGSSLSPMPPQPNNNTIPPSAQRQNQNHVPLPHHFIVRPGVTRHTASGTVTAPGPIVPLVPVDQLPEWVGIIGVPRELGLEQTVGLTNLGTVVRNPDYYQVYMHNSLQQAPPAPPAIPSSITEGASRESRQHQQQQQQQRPMDENGIRNDNGVLIPVNASYISASSSTSSTLSSSLESATESPLNTRVDPAMRSLASSIHNPNTNTIPSKKAEGTGNPTTVTKPEKPKAISNGSNIPLLYPQQRLPSPTVAGSTPPMNPNSSPYPMMHPYNPLQPSLYVTPSIPTLHPADRMQQTWYNPSAPSGAKNSHTSIPPSTSTTRKNTSSTSTSQPPNPSSGGGSIYCKHWCHRGTCRWGPQCRYAHAMPATPEGLREVGLGHHPAWWTAAMNMAFGAGGFGGGQWYAGPGTAGGVPTVGMLAQVHARGGGGGSGRRALREERKREKVKEKEKDKQKGAENVVKSKGKGVDEKNIGGQASESKSKVDSEQGKRSVVEGKASAVVSQGDRKPEQPQETQKLVEI